MDKKQLITINQNSKQVLIKSKNLLDITKKILEKKDLIENFEFKPFLMGKRHSDNISSIVISPDGKYIVSGSEDSTIEFWDIKTEDRRDNEKGTIKIWDIKSGKCLNTLVGHNSPINSIISYALFLLHNPG